ncbi:MAG: AAA family ATPase [Pseudonocardiaceae bacterium]
MTVLSPATSPARLEGYPDWARELDARLPVSSQLVLAGNVHDIHLVESGARPLLPTAEVVAQTLVANGYQVVLQWHVVTGLSVLHESEPGSVTHLLGKDLLSSTEGRGGGRSADGLADTMRAVVQAGERSRGAQAGRIGLVVDGAHRLCADPADPHLHRLFVTARHVARTAPRHALSGDRREGLANTVVWIVDREADLPHWLVSAETVRVVSLPLPELGTRQRAAQHIASSLPGYPELDKALQFAARRTVTELTEGMPLSALPAIAVLARDHDVAATEVQDAVRLLRSGLQKSPWSDPEIRSRIRGAAEGLNERVLGQQRAIRSASDILSRAGLGLSGAQSAGHPSRPQGVIFFAGPTGVGKTELAKQIAEIVFGREEAMQRFDMSEFSAEHSEARLIGSPPGYVGHEAGGELTNAVRQRPFSLLLFDEIEKAHPLILDKFLQILEDGRLTDGSGSTVHFTETLIVFTSNLGIYQVDENNRRIPVVTPGTDYDVLAQRVKQAIRDDFTLRIGRPELLNRIGDNIVVFDFISPAVACQLLHRNLENVARHVHRRTATRITFGGELLDELEKAVVEPERLAFGGRAVGSLIESRVLNPLARILIAAPPGLPELTLTRTRHDAEGFHLDVAQAGG